MSFDTYTIYCDHMIALGRKPPTKAWWNDHCRGRTTPKVVVFEPDFDLEIERREGWGYGYD